MIILNGILACHHIRFEATCGWCGIYRRQAIKECDRCHRQINTDMVALALTAPQPQLICTRCQLREINTRGG